MYPKREPAWISENGLGFRVQGVDICKLSAVLCRDAHPKATQTLLTASQNRASQQLSQHHETNWISQFRFCVGGTLWAEGPCH